MAHLEILPAMLGFSVLEIPCYTSYSYPKNGFRSSDQAGDDPYHGRSQVNGELESILIEKKSTASNGCLAHLLNFIDACQSPRNDQRSTSWRLRDLEG